MAGRNIKVVILLLSLGSTLVVVGKGLRARLRINISAKGNDTEDCLDGSFPCNSLEYVSQHIHNLSYVEVIFSAGLYEFNGVALNGVTNVTIAASGSSIVLRCKSDSANLAFIGSNNIVIAGITFEGCGPVASALYVSETSLVYINNCVFRHNNGQAVQFLNSTDIVIKNSLFFNNSGEIYDATPITEEYGFVVNQSYGAVGIMYENFPSAKVKVQNCTFDSNHARRHPLNVNDTRPGDYQPFGTGGGIFIRFSNASCGCVEILKCKFINNTALVRGGGVYVSFWGYSSSNYITIANSSFDNNYCSDTGGAISLNSFPSGFDNFITVTGCNFTRNKAEVSSGALVYQFSSGMLDQITDRIELKWSVFKENLSPSVSAVSFLAVSRTDQQSQPVLIEDTSFDGNNAFDNTSLSKKHIASAIFTEIPVVFKGFNQFSNNRGRGVTIAKERIDIHNTVIFENNSVPDGNGGGLKAEDKSFAQIFSGTLVTFRNNTANVGGAISVPTPAIYDDGVRYNTLCFLQYQLLGTEGLTPEQWNFSMSFEDNQASRGGGAVYTNDVSPCAYVPSYEGNTTIQSLPLFNRSLFTLPQFEYSGNMITEQSVVGNNPTFFSGASDLQLTINLEHNTVALCEIFECEVKSFDQSGNLRSAIFQINSRDVVTCAKQMNMIHSVENTGSVYATVCDVDLTGHCDRYSNNRLTNITQTLTYTIIDEISGDALLEQHLSVNISCCHTGYVYDELQRKCVFDTFRSIFVAESLNRRYVYIKTRFFGQHLEDNQFFSAVVPSSYYKCHMESGTTIKGCLFKFDHPYQQCLGNRTGFLCGQCPSPKGLTLNLRECQTCEASQIIIFVLVCILVVAISFVIMTFDIGLPNNLRGFLFFAQIVSIVYQRNSKGGINLDYHLARLFGISLYLPICLSRNMDALSVTLLGLCVPLIMLMTIVVFIFLARHIRYLGHHQSINGIWLLIFLMYVFTMRTSFDLMRCVPMYDIDDNFKGFRFFYDGSIKCFQGKHLIYMFISILLIFTIIVPGPCVVALISYRHFNRMIPFRDVATKGIELQYRWWSAYDFLRRVAYILIVIFEGYLYEYHQLILTFVSLVCLIITARLHPYKNSWSNLIETLVLLDLLLIAAYFLNDHSSHLVTSKFEDAFAVFLLLIPFAYGVLYIIISVIRKIWYKYKYRHWEELQGVEESFIAVPPPLEDKKGSEYSQYRDELLVIDSIKT